MGELRRLMWAKVGPFRDRPGLSATLDRIHAMRTDDLPRVPVPRDVAFANELADWHELRSALLVAEAVTVAALAREESRGAHQRDDFPQISERFRGNQQVTGQAGTVACRLVPIAPEGVAG